MLGYSPFQRVLAPCKPIPHLLLPAPQPCPDPTVLQAAFVWESPLPLGLSDPLPLAF